MVKRKTAPSRLVRAFKRIAWWCRLHRHDPIEDQHRTLSQKLRGHYAYYGITCNDLSLKALYDGVKRVWRQWLARRNLRVGMPWDTFAKLLQRYPLPPPVIVHSV